MARVSSDLNFFETAHLVARRAMVNSVEITSNNQETILRAGPWFAPPVVRLAAVKAFEFIANENRNPARTSCTQKFSPVLWEIVCELMSNAPTGKQYQKQGKRNTSR